MRRWKGTCEKRRHPTYHHAALSILHAASSIRDAVTPTRLPTASNRIAVQSEERHRESRPRPLSRRSRDLAARWPAQKWRVRSAKVPSGLCCAQASRSIYKPLLSHPGWTKRIEASKKYVCCEPNWPRKRMHGKLPNESSRRTQVVEPVPMEQAPLGHLHVSVMQELVDRMGVSPRGRSTARPMSMTSAAQQELISAAQQEYTFTSPR